jgi:hypothetical protein
MPETNSNLGNTLLSKKSSSQERFLRSKKKMSGRTRYLKPKTS